MGERFGFVLHNPALTTCKSVEQCIACSSNILLVYATRLPPSTDEPIGPSWQRQSHHTK